MRRGLATTSKEDYISMYSKLVSHVAHIYLSSAVSRISEYVRRHPL